MNMGWDRSKYNYSTLPSRPFMLTITWFYVEKLGEVGTEINVMGIGIMVMGDG